jgi:hypothetical protein
MKLKYGIKTSNQSHEMQTTTVMKLASVDDVNEALPIPPRTNVRPPVVPNGLSVEETNNKLSLALPPTFLEQFNWCVSVDCAKLISFENLTTRRKLLLEKRDLVGAKELKEQRDALKFTPPSPSSGITAIAIKEKLQSLLKINGEFYKQLIDEDVDDDILEVNICYQDQIEELLKLFKTAGISSNAAVVTSSLGDNTASDRVFLSHPLQEASGSSGRTLVLDAKFAYANTSGHLIGVKVKLFTGENAFEDAKREYNFMVKKRKKTQYLHVCACLGSIL